MSCVVEDVARGWATLPELVAIPDSKSRLGAALWGYASKDPQEVSGPVRTDYHIISVQQTSYAVEVVRKDGRDVFCGQVAAGSAQLMEAGVCPYSIQTGEWSVLHLYLPTSTVDEALEAAEISMPSSALAFIDPVHEQRRCFARLASEVRCEMALRLPLSRLRIDMLGLDLAVSLLRRYSNAAPMLGFGPAAKSASTDWRLRKAMEFLDAVLAEDVSLKEVAAAVGISMTHLATLFRSGTGEPPHRWLMRRRLERACVMLAETRHSVTEVAHQCGFASSQHLATVFLKRLGLTPSDYRRERLS